MLPFQRRELKLEDRDLEFALNQRIGVYYLDNKWKEEMFLKLANYYGNIDIIKSMQHLKNGSRIQLTDGSVIDFVQANENCRGRRYSKIIMQQGISEEFIDCVIKHALTYPNRRCMIFDDGEIRFT